MPSPLPTLSVASTVAELNAERDYTRLVENYRSAYPEPKKEMSLNTKIKIAVGLTAGAFLTAALIFSPASPLIIMGAGSTGYILSGVLSDSLIQRNLINPSTSALVSTAFSIVAVATGAFLILGLGIASPWMVPTAITLAIGMVAIGSAHYLAMQRYDNLPLPEAEDAI